MFEGYGRTMRLYFTWLFGYNYDSDSSRVQNSEFMAKEEEKIHPVGQRTVCVTLKPSGASIHTVYISTVTPL
jgi:hypothetical protein